MSRRAPPTKGRRAPPTKSGRGIRARGQFLLSKLLDDTATVSDSPTITVAFSRALADSASVSETILLALGRALGDAVSAADQVQIGFTKPLSDSAATTDAGVILQQDYCDITYFASDYVGSKFTF